MLHKFNVALSKAIFWLEEMTTTHRKLFVRFFLMHSYGQSMSKLRAIKINDYLLMLVTRTTELTRASGCLLELSAVAAMAFALALALAFVALLANCIHMRTSVHYIL